MIVFLLVLTILFLLSTFILLVCLSSLELEISNLKFDTDNNKNNKLEDYLFYIRLKILDKITWLKIKVDKNKIKKIEKSNFFKSTILNKINRYDNLRDIISKNKKEIFNKSNINLIKYINPKLKKFNLNMDICTSDNIFTSFSVAIIASLISIFLARNIEKIENNNYRYIITPKYEQKPNVKIKLDCIIDIKIVHIINIIYMIIKKRSVVNDERTSYRRTYVCSND